MNTEKMIKILKYARAEIKSGREQFICLAIKDYPHGKDTEPNYLVRWIGSMLDGSYVLEDWLGKHYVTPFGRGNTQGHYRKLRKTRVNWIDWMINELKEGR